MAAAARAQRARKKITENCLSRLAAAATAAATLGAATGKEAQLDDVGAPSSNVESNAGSITTEHGSIDDKELTRHDPSPQPRCREPS
jgi:hypothetical protein